MFCICRVCFGSRGAWETFECVLSRRAVSSTPCSRWNITACFQFDSRHGPLLEIWGSAHCKLFILPALPCHRQNQFQLKRLLCWKSPSTDEEVSRDVVKGKGRGEKLKVISSDLTQKLFYSQNYFIPKTTNEILLTSQLVGADLLLRFSSRVVLISLMKPITKNVH